MYWSLQICTSGAIVGISPVTTHHQRYKGFFPYKVDPKFRISIPSTWRPEAGGTLFLLFSKAHDMPVLKVLSEEAYNAKVELILNSDMDPAEQGEMLGDLAMLCREVTLNEQNKLLVPKDLSEKAGIAAESSVFLVGRGIYFEVWCKDNFDTMLDLVASRRKADNKLGIF